MAGLPAARALRLALALREPDNDVKIERVTQLARAVALRVGLSEDAASVVELAASVKDVGRLAVPDSLLVRRGPLTPQEWEQIKGHVLAAEALLLKLPELRALAPIVRSAHERWDGEGYPDGQAGEDIPLPSRIIAACDAYVAMTSDRVFREALDEASGIHQVMEIAGSQLDPAVAKALVSELTGRETRDVEANGRPRSVARHNRAEAKDLLARLDSLDPIPALLIARDRLLDALGQRHTTSEDVVPHIESDPGLALVVLHSANSAAAGATVSSIPEALSVLSWVELGEVARKAPALDFLWPGTQWEAALGRFRLHAVAVQRASMRLADATGYGELDRLATAALLHDIGRLALAQLRSDYLGRVSTLRSAEERLTMERRDFGVDHATVGGIVARRCGLSEALAEAISEHHNVEAGRESQLLCLADALAHHSHARSALPAAMIEVGLALGLAADDLRTITFELPHSDGSRRLRTEPSPLSRRELEALRGLAEGKVYGEIADGLGVKPSTVRSHLHSVYRKLDVTDRAQAVLMATERGWL